MTCEQMAQMILREYNQQYPDSAPHLHVVCAGALLNGDLAVVCSEGFGAALYRILRYRGRFGPAIKVGEDAFIRTPLIVHLGRLHETMAEYMKLMANGEQCGLWGTTRKS